MKAFSLSLILAFAIASPHSMIARGFGGVRGGGIGGARGGGVGRSPGSIPTRGTGVSGVAALPTGIRGAAAVALLRSARSSSAGTPIAIADAAGVTRASVTIRGNTAVLRNNNGVKIANLRIVNEKVYFYESEQTTTPAGYAEQVFSDTLRFYRANDAGEYVFEGSESLSTIVSRMDTVNQSAPRNQSVAYVPMISGMIAAPSRIQSGQRWTNSLGMIFVPVSGLTAAFSIWETRVRDYEAFANATRRDWEKASFPQDPTHPAVNVSWEDAQAFCRWLTAKEHDEGKLAPDQSYQLPTDAEWSVAVGLENENGATPADKDGKIQGVYPWGKQSPPPKSAGNYASSLDVDSFANTAPVGSFAANGHGLYDLGGNVWEWCEDEYRPGSGTRVLRGASWLYDVQLHLLSSYRRLNSPGFRINLTGFRCVLVGLSSP